MPSDNDVTTFEFSVPTKVFFGLGSRRHIVRSLVSKNWRCVGLVVDHNIADLDHIRELVDSLEEETEVVYGICDVSEPTYDDLDRIRTQYETQELDAIVGIGGGSTLDVSKAMAVLVHNRDPAITYRGFDVMDKPVLPIVAVPTTAGTGSEVTPNASFVDRPAKRKMGINGEAVRPLLAFLDPELTVTCPPEATVSAALDSVVHGTEAYVAKKSNSIARMLALEGMRTVLISLPKVVDKPDDLESRKHVMYGAFLAGLALMHSGTGPAAALSYPFGVHFGVPHGIGGAIFLPHVAQLNVDRGYNGYSSLYRSFSDAKIDISDNEASQKFVDHLSTTWGKLGVPDDLDVYGFEDKHVDLVVSDTLDLMGALEQNPVDFGEEEIRIVLQRFLDKRS